MTDESKPVPAFDAWLDVHTKSKGIDLVAEDERLRLQLLAPCGDCFRLGIAVAVEPGSACTECGVIAELRF